ncbi:MAG: fibrobacter succinogenes major paralogous domain-containing protein [Muribaculaceae bacterium]|nr:fibrobacter succinogenes major paralogous domain-containing protein [Muribaculaceae bacterium]
MRNHIFKATAGIIAAIGTIGAVSSCSDTEVTPGSVSEAPYDMSVKLKGMPTPAGAPSGQEALSVFQFGPEGLFSKKVIDSYDPEAINLVKGTTRALYCVSGLDIDATAETTETEFALTTVSTAEGENTAPLFLSAYTALEASQMNCELTMKRGVARIDLDARDADMDISSITVDDAPVSTYVFAGESPIETATTVYSHEYAEAPTGVEKGVFLIFESGKEVHVSVHGTAEGQKITVPAVIETVERNKVYTLRVYDQNAAIKASFNVADWVDGGSISSNTDTANRLAFDMDNSVFPEGVTVDYANNIIEVPSTGVSGMTVAFNTDLRVDIDSVYFYGDRVEVDSIKEKHVSIDVAKAVNTPTGVVTKVNININEQLKARPGYEIKLDLRKMNMTLSHDHFTIRVAESPYQIQTVEIGGLTWMAFNATSSDLSEQLFPADGLTVEETYQQHWASSIGNFFQYGRLKSYSPWTKNDPNGNDVTRNIPWNTPEFMPLPPGYHVASTAEWQKLIPNGTTIPSTYTAANGESIKAEIVQLPGTLDDSPSAAANKANLLKRYIRFESLETGNVLILPVCALKTASMDEYPGGGRKMHAWASYWIAEDRYTWLFQIAENNGSPTATQARDRWNYNGFMPVRGVKD